MWQSPKKAWLTGKKTPTTMKQGDIYYVDLAPTVGSEQAGKRPAVIVSGNTMNDHLGIVLVCPLSTHIKAYPTCVTLRKKQTKLIKKRF